MTLENDPTFEDVEVQETTLVKGVKTGVKHINENSRPNTVLGHVLFLDIEDVNLEVLVQECENNFDYYFIFRTSENNYHVINPVVRSLEDTYRIMNNFNLQDSDHTEIGLSKGSWTLRATEKGHKDKPELIKYEVPYPSIIESNFDEIVSKPHLEYIEEWHGVDLNMNHLDTVGDTLEIVTYYTRPNNHELSD